MGTLTSVVRTAHAARSVTDMCGFTDFFGNCHGDDARATNGQPFTYLDSVRAIDFTKRLVGTFFEQQLMGRSLDSLEATVAQEPALLQLEHRAR